MAKNARTLLLMLLALISVTSFSVLILSLPSVQSINTDIYLWINKFYWSPLADLTALLETPAELYGVLLALILAFFKRYDLALCILIAIVIDIVYVTLVKDLTAMARPFIELNGVNVAYFPKDFSFPSGHAAGSFAVFSAWCFRERRHYVPLLAFATLISISRVYIGVHYPMDVIAGAIIGLIIGFSVAQLDLTVCKQIISDMYSRLRAGLFRQTNA